ncbi:hypothetical protein BC827DRAFT_37366 [Russula dissimulans]|nr:hypothetical protein BC827DRAFT_37366 [Russula dissimulans]
MNACRVCDDGKRGGWMSGRTSICSETSSTAGDDNHEEHRFLSRTRPPWFSFCDISGLPLLLPHEICVPPTTGSPSSPHLPRPPASSMLLASAASLSVRMKAGERWSRVLLQKIMFAPDLRCNILSVPPRLLDRSVQVAIEFTVRADTSPVRATNEKASS